MKQDGTIEEMYDFFNYYLMVKPDEIVELEKLLQQRFERKVLDYSLASLDTVELFLEEQMKEFTIEICSLDKLIEIISSYMGDMVKKALNGKWDLCLDKEHRNYRIPIIVKMDGLLENFGWSPLQTLSFYESNPRKGKLRLEVESLLTFGPRRKDNDTYIGHFIELNSQGTKTEMMDFFERYLSEIPNNLNKLALLLEQYAGHPVLDYTLDSLIIIETYLDTQLENYTATFSSIHKLKEVISSYMGEIVRIDLNGKWGLELDNIFQDYGLPIIKNMDGCSNDFSWAPLEIVQTYTDEPKRLKGFLRRATDL